MRIIDGPQYGWVEAIGIHHIYHWLSVYEGYEGNLTTVWRPRGTPVVGGVVGKTRHTGAVCVHVDSTSRIEWYPRVTICVSQTINMDYFT